MGLPFKIGETYKRTEFQKTFGGQRQGGISTPAKYPFIFIFTGDNGKSYGYKDKFEGGIFYYTGEGQRGDMEFIKGNKAIRNSDKNGEEIYLFKYDTKYPRGYVEFMGQMVYKNYSFQQGHDLDGNPRKLIVFELAQLK